MSIQMGNMRFPEDKKHPQVPAVIKQQSQDTHPTVSFQSLCFFQTEMIDEKMMVQGLEPNRKESRSSPLRTMSGVPLILITIGQVLFYVDFCSCFAIVVVAIVKR